MTQDDERRQLDAVREDLLREYSGLAPEMVNARFHAIVAEFEGAPVRSFVPVLAQRRLRQALHDAS
jgi:hypothetical protein